MALIEAGNATHPRTTKETFFASLGVRKTPALTFQHESDSAIFVANNRTPAHVVKFGENGIGTFDSSGRIIQIEFRNISQGVELDGFPLPYRTRQIAERLFNLHTQLGPGTDEAVERALQAKREGRTITFKHGEITPKRQPPLREDAQDTGSMDDWAANRPKLHAYPLGLPSPETL